MSRKFTNFHVNKKHLFCAWLIYKLGGLTFHQKTKKILQQIKNKQLWLVSKLSIYILNVISIHEICKQYNSYWHANWNWRVTFKFLHG